ncbi:MAG TPA: peptidylprolyl isomerase [bacterium]|nr:peptidylprolyl isomerase [bacterium]
MEIIENKRGIFEVFKYTSLFLLVTFLLACSGPRNRRQVDQQENDREPVAIVGQDTISLYQFKESYQTAIMRTSVNDNLENRKHHLYKMAEGYLMAQAAKQDNLDTIPQFQYRKNMFERKAMRDYMFENIGANIDIDKTKLKEAFRRSRQSRLVRHLFSRRKEEIDKMYQQLKSGEFDFRSLAQQSFSDSALRNNGGLLGWINWGDTGLKFENAVYNLESGQISKPFQSMYGWHIVKVEKIKREILPTSQDYKEFVAKNRKKLERIYKEEKLAEYLNNFMKEQNLKLNLPLLRTISQKLKPKYKNYFLGQNQNFNKLPPQNVESLVLELDEILDQTLVNYKNGQWKVRDYIKRLPELPAQFILTDIEKSVALALRNDLLAEQGREKGINNKTEVQDRVQLRSYEILSHLKSRQLLDSIPYEKRLNWTDEDARLYRIQQWRHKKNEFIEQQKKKVPINFYYDKLENLYSDLQ